MARRIEIELTSKVDDESWTWRAAGARQPKGTLASKVLPDGAKVGDVLRAEVQDDIDGITVLAILAGKEKRAEPERLTILAPPEPRPSPPDPRTSRSGGKDDRRPRGERAERPDRADRRERTDRPERGRPDRGGRERRPEQPRGDRRGPRPPRGERPEPAPERPKPKRLNPGHVHRNAVLADLPPEHKPVAEQVLRGGIPAVRQAIDDQNALLKEQGQSPIAADPLLTLAEELLPRLKSAEWRDRADAATAAGTDISLRDLRSVVTSAEARDDETRLLARSLREELDRRLKAEREAWLSEIDGALTAGRVVRALRIASRPPDPAMRFPADVGTRLAESAGAAMAPDAPPDRWLAVLDAVSVSPVRRSVTPAGLPADPPDDFVKTVKQAASRVPAVGPLVGIQPGMVPPPPRPRPPRPPKPEGALPQRRPPGAAAPADVPPETEEDLKTADT